MCLGLRREARPSHPQYVFSSVNAYTLFAEIYNSHLAFCEIPSTSMPVTEGILIGNMVSWTCWQRAIHLNSHSHGEQAAEHWAVEVNVIIISLFRNRSGWLRLTNMFLLVFSVSGRPSIGWLDVGLLNYYSGNVEIQVTLLINFFLLGKIYTFRLIRNGKCLLHVDAEVISVLVLWRNFILKSTRGWIHISRPDGKWNS